MPRPLTLRQERFCQAYVLNPTAAGAARVAGYSKASARKQGWRLLRSTRIRARLLDIQTELARDLRDSVDGLVGKLEVVYRLAVQDRRTLAAVRAVELQGRFIQLKRRRCGRNWSGGGRRAGRWRGAGRGRRRPTATIGDAMYPTRSTPPPAIHEPVADKCVHLRTVAYGFQIGHRPIPGDAAARLALRPATGGDAVARAGNRQP